MILSKINNSISIYFEQTLHRFEIYSPTNVSRILLVNVDSYYFLIDPRVN